MKLLIACVLLASVGTRMDTPVCGNHVVEPGESCDDGNQTAGDGCDATCHREPVCGDGTLDRGEECDDGNRTNNDGCDDHCRKEHAPVCGNGIKEGEEECDDGNLLDGDSCDSTCHLERACCCGNGRLDPDEDCDDGNDIDNDGCSTGCKIDPMWQPTHQRRLSSIPTKPAPAPISLQSHRPRLHGRHTPHESRNAVKAGMVGTQRSPKRSTPDDLVQ